jgi:hypothetical protein
MQQLKYRPAILFGSLSGFISTFLLLFLLLMFTGSMSLMTLASATIDYFSYLSPGLLIVVCPIIIVIGGLGGVIGERYAKRREEEVDNTFLRSIYGIVGGSIAGLTIGGPILFCVLGAG